MRAALINAETGIVENVIEVDDGNDGVTSDYPVPDGMALRPLAKDDMAGPGWRRTAKGKLVPPDPKDEPERAPTLEDRVAALEAIVAAWSDG